MIANDPAPRAAATRPRALVLVNGEVADGVVSVEVDNNVFYHADTFRIVFALSASRGAAWWSEVTEAEVEIHIGYPPDPTRYSATDLDRVLIGFVDDIQIEPSTDQVRVIGRDLTARLIDAKTVEQYRNQTASEIATLLAQRRGLTPEVTPTKTKAGTYYARDRVSLSDSQPEWDLLTYLAEQEGFRVFVTGRTLYFGPAPQREDPYVIRWTPPAAGRPLPSSNALTLLMRRNLTVSRSIVVVVRSWNQKQQQGFTVRAERRRVRNRVTTRALRLPESPQVYSFVIPNATPQAAQDYANRKLEQLSQHELQIEATLPGDSILDMRRLVQLEGTATAFDQVYFPSSVIRRFSLAQGYTMELVAKNSDANPTVLP